ncbi:MAG: KAP family NTPase [Campylobacteraceae bacterium]|jgi:hypothetical protein|nr:KAP family NTPase [Campylobacteraceae bacterium]
MFEKAIDEPIRQDEEDILGFKNISGKIADAIKAFPSGKKTFTIAIEGEWGSGKTSLANLIENKIKDDVILVHFNPWMVDNFEQLTKYFFAELVKEIARCNFGTKFQKEILSDMKKFVEFVASTGFGIDLSKYIKEKTLYKLKETINGYLHEIDKKIVIIIDDIDRLTDKETETLFRLIKGIADFDNIIYILLYDKQIVANSLEKFKNEKGEKYLDKIVQYSISVPKPFDGQLVQELDKKIEQIFKKIEQDKKKYIFTKYDEYRWDVVNKDKYIKSLRDLNKIIAIMSFEYPVICEDVNFVDYFIISLIKLNDITLYNSIKNHPESYFIFKKHALESIEDAERKFLENFEKEDKPLSHKELLEVIFPILSKNKYSQPQHIHKNKPLASAVYFGNYFAFDPSPRTISSKQYNAIKDLMFSTKQKEFRKNIIKLDNASKSRLFVYMFYEIDFENLSILESELYNGIINIFSVAYLVKEGVYDECMEWNDIDPYSEYYTLGLDLFGKLKDKKKVDDVFKNKQISLLIKSYILRDYKKEKKLFLSNEHFDMLDLKVKSAFEKLTFEEIVNNKDSKGIEVLSSMKYYGLLDGISARFREKIFSSKEWFFKILNFFKYWQRSSSENRYLIDKELIKEVLSIEEIDTYIKNLDAENLTKNEKELLDIWSRKNI